MNSWKISEVKISIISQKSHTK